MATELPHVVAFGQGNQETLPWKTSYESSLHMSEDLRCQPNFGAELRLGPYIPS